MGLSRSLAAKWKNTGANPSAEVLPKIAAYFGVTVDYLLGNEQKEKPATDEGDEPLEDCIVLHMDGKTKRYKFTQKQLDLMAEMIKQLGEEKD